MITFQRNKSFRLFLICSSPMSTVYSIIVPKMMFFIPLGVSGASACSFAIWSISYLLLPVILDLLVPRYQLNIIVPILNLSKLWEPPFHLLDFLMNVDWGNPSALSFSLKLHANLKSLRNTWVPSLSNIAILDGVILRWTIPCWWSSTTESTSANRAYLVLSVFLYFYIISSRVSE